MNDDKNRTPPWHKNPWLVGTAALLLITTFLLVAPSRRGTALQLAHYPPPTCTIFHLHGHDVYVQPVQVPRGVLFVAHGCSHSGGDFCVPSDACPDCLGLPEELTIARHAAQRRFALVTISSSDRASSKCWSVDTDLHSVALVLHEVLQKYKWTHVPLYAMGASSGGAFILHLPTASNAPPIAGLCSQIMGIPANTLHDLAMSTHHTDYPPTIFAHMPRDQHTASLVHADVDILQALGIRSIALPILPQPITPTFFSDRILNMTPGMSRHLVDALAAQSTSMIDPVKHMLQHDPRGTVDIWRPALERAAEEHGLAGLSLEADRSAVFEELNVAWAGHEIVADVMDDVFEFWHG